MASAASVILCIPDESEREAETKFEIQGPPSPDGSADASTGSVFVDDDDDAAAASRPRLSVSNFRDGPPAGAAPAAGFVSISAKVGLQSLPKASGRGNETVVIFDEASTFAFISALFHYHNTVFAEILPQLGFGVFMVLVSASIEQWGPWRNGGSLVGDDDADDDGGDDDDDAGSSSFLPKDAQKFHALAGAVIGFLLALRTNLAYDRYYEGRKLIGNMLNSLRETVSIACAPRAPRALPPLTVSFSEIFREPSEPARPPPARQVHVSRRRAHPHRARPRRHARARAARARAAQGDAAVGLLAPGHAREQGGLRPRRRHGGAGVQQ